MRKFLSIVLTVILTLSILPTGMFRVVAITETTENFEGYYTYTVENGEATIIDVDSSISGHITIPSTLGGYPVTEIGTGAFYDCSNISSLTIHEDLVFIDSKAFYGCSNLKTLNLNAKNCSSWYIPGTEYEGPCWSNLTTINFGSSVETIGEFMFSGCNKLTAITTPININTIEGGAFNNCSNLKTLNLNAKNCIGSGSSNGWQYLQTVNFGDAVEHIGDAMFSGCNKLTAITIPNNIISIGKDAFSSCTGIENINIPNSVTSIGEDAFFGCTSLEKITGGENLKSIGRHAFYYTKLYNSQSNGLIYIGKTLYLCKGTCPSTVTVKTGTLGIAEDAFYLCETLENIILPNTLANIDKNAFRYCTKIKEITLPKSVITIGDGAFNSSGLECVWYTGSEIEKKSMVISGNNSCLINAQWHYNTCTGAHNYSNLCQAQCSFCEFKRTPQHSFKWITDLEPTCAETGIKHEECTLCHTTQNQNTVISATGNHNYEWIIDEENNCGLNGKKHKECNVCHKKIDQNTLISATGNHTYDNTCDIECNVCKQTRTISHGYDDINDTVCNVCGADIGLVRFSLNGGTGGFEPIVVEQGKTVFLPQAIPSKVGYRFAGWSKTKNGNIDYYAKNELLLNESVTLWAQWDLICDGCSGDGKILKQTICLSCNGSGNKYETSTCSSCGGSGLSYSSKDCPACNAGWIIVGSSHTRCTSCGGSGSISLPKSCSGCGGQGINRYPYNCNSCGGVGKSYYESDCEECDKTGVYIRSNVEKPNVPTVLLNGGTTVELVSIQNGEYSLDGINWQESPIFDNLVINKEYTFYQRYAKTDTTFVSEASDALIVRTLEQPQYAPGDIDGVEGVTDADAVYLLYHTFLSDIYPVNQDCDFNGDGEVNDKDAVYLLYHTFLPDLYPIN